MKKPEKNGNGDFTNCTLKEIFIRINEHKVQVQQDGGLIESRSELRVLIDEYDMEAISEVARRTGFSEADIWRIILEAGKRAVAEKGLVKWE